MKRGIVFLVVLAAIFGLAYYSKTTASSRGPEVVCFLRVLRIPEWNPLSRGYMPGAPQNPEYVSLKNDRHLVIILDVPAGWLQALEHDEDGELIYPDIDLTFEDGPTYAVRDVVAWPRGNSFSGPEDFTNPDEWTVKPTDKPGKRYRLAMLWRVVLKLAHGPFELQIGEEPPIHIPSSQYNTFIKW